MRFAAVHRGKVDSVLFEVSSEMTGRKKKIMFSVGKKPGPAMSGVFLFVEDGRRSHRAGLHAHFRESALKVGSVYDHVVGSPRGSARIPGIGEYRYRPSRGRNLS